VSERVLIVRLGSLGDVIHGIPAAAALRRRHPDARIDWLVEPRYVAVLRLVRGLDRVIDVDTRGGAVHLARVARTLRAEGYTAVVDLQGLLKSAILALAAVAPRRIGFPREHLREPLARFFYTETRDPGSAAHVIHKNLALVGALGVTERRVEFPLDVPCTEAGDAAESRLGRGYVLINPGAAWPNKRWPAERFGSVAAALRDRMGLRSLVLWGPREEALAAAVVAASRGAAELAPPTSISDLFDIAHRARVIVSGDTGPLHVAAAVGTPVVGLFGPTSTARNGPWADGDAVVSRHERCECAYERRCRRAVPCIADISTGEVVAAVERRLAS
jgi:heptosyltransferase-1